jgi:hypothetical protein
MSDGNEGNEEPDQESLEALEATIEELDSEFEDELGELELTDELGKVGRNIDESTDEIGELVDAVKEGDVQSKSDVLTHLVKISNSTATTTGTVAGALAGSLAGPIGSIAGAVIGGTSAYLYTSDEKRVIAVPVNESETPENAKIHTIDDIQNQPDIRSLVENVASEQEASQEASNLLRELDFDKIRSELDRLGRTDTEDLEKYAGYYFEHEGQRIVVMIDVD